MLLDVKLCSSCSPLMGHIPFWLSIVQIQTVDFGIRVSATIWLVNVAALLSVQDGLSHVNSPYASPTAQVEDTRATVTDWCLMQAFMGFELSRDSEELVEDI